MNIATLAPFKSQTPCFFLTFVVITVAHGRGAAVRLLPPTAAAAAAALVMHVAVETPRPPATPAATAAATAAAPVNLERVCSSGWTNVSQFRCESITIYTSVTSEQSRQFSKINPCSTRI